MSHTIKKNHDLKKKIKFELSDFWTFRSQSVWQLVLTIYSEIWFLLPHHSQLTFCPSPHISYVSPVPTQLIMCSKALTSVPAPIPISIPISLQLPWPSDQYLWLVHQCPLLLLEIWFFTLQRTGWRASQGLLHILPFQLCYYSIREEDRQGWWIGIGLFFIRLECRRGSRGTRGCWTLSATPRLLWK